MSPGAAHAARALTAALRLLLLLALSSLSAPVLANNGDTPFYITPALLETQMRYLRCGPVGELGDVWLHMIASATAGTPGAASCANWDSIAGPDASARLSRMLYGGLKTVGGCKNVTCDEPAGGAKPLGLTLFLYMRIIEFGREQSASCKYPRRAIATFVTNAATACSDGPCGMASYQALRPGDKQGCPPMDDKEDGRRRRSYARRLSAARRLMRYY